MTGPHVDADVPDLEVTLRPDAPPAAAGAAVQAVALGVGLPAERATRLRALVEQLVSESRSRECVGGSEDIAVRTGHGAGTIRVHVVDRRLPVAPGEARHFQSRRLASLGFADRLHIGSGGAAGNVSTCIVDVDELHEAEALRGAEVLTSESPPATDDQVAALEVRAMEPGDAAGLARCVYRCYGYTYLDPVLYRPRQIRRALHSGLMRSVVAVDGDGEVVGHCALTFDRTGDPVPEAGKLVVDPRYRGHHIAERMAGVRRDLAAGSGMVGYWSECVTNHPFSQREVIGTGGAETGLLIGAVPSALTMQGLDNRTDGRHTLLPMFVPVGERRAAEVHVPERHAEVLADMARAVGLPRTLHTVAESATGRTDLSVGVGVDAGVAHIRVTRPGDDLVDRVADEMDGLQAFDLGAVHLDLPLASPATIGAVGALERLGFCWGAWVPCFTGAGDVLRLQRVGDHPVEVERIACARPEGEAVRDHVLAEWHRVRHGH